MHQKGLEGAGRVVAMRSVVYRQLLSSGMSGQADSVTTPSVYTLPRIKMPRPVEIGVLSMRRSVVRVEPAALAEFWLQRRR